MTLKTLAQAAEDSQNRKILVAVDYGTTFSGVAWVHTLRPETKDCIVQWPDANGSLEGKTQEKVPTELLYEDGTVKWGYQIREDECRHQWFKLALDGDQPDSISHLTVEYPDPKALPPDHDHDPIKLTTDYLTCLREHTIDMLKLKLGRALLDSIPVEFIITVPAISSDAAKARTSACAASAGMGENVRIISEPEAAVVYALDAMDPHNLKAGDTFVLCDAGGGTVDLISYTIEELEPRVKVKEAVAGGGDSCGSTFLNRIFGKYLQDNFGDDDEWDDELQDEAMSTFEVQKREFTGNEGKLVINISGYPDDLARGIKRGRLTIPAKQVKTLFQPIMATITTLVRQQIKQTKNCKAVLLVGGFGRSVYLRKCIENVVGTDVEVIQPANAWTAVVKGALIWALSDDSPDTSRIDISSRRARKSYGLKAGTSFIPTFHDASRKYWDDYLGVYRIKTMHWEVKMGDELDSRKPLSANFYISQLVAFGPLMNATVQLYVHESATNVSPPLYSNSESRKLVTLRADLSTIATTLIPIQRGADGMDYYHLGYEINIAFFSAHTEYSLWYKGVEYGKVEAEYA